jgi:hypothetical protein
MIAVTVAVVGAAIMLNAPAQNSLPVTGSVQDFLPCNSAALKAALAAEMTDLGRKIGMPPNGVAAGIADMRGTEFKPFNDGGYAALQLMVPAEDVRLCEGSGEHGRQWVIGEFRNGDQIEGAIFNTNSGALQVKFPIAP